MRQTGALVVVMILIGFALIVALSSPVAINVTPRVLLAGQTIRLTCVVPRSPENRWLNYGVAGYTYSMRQLDGDQAPITYTAYVQHVPCEASEAFCDLVQAGERHATVTAGITVAGCEP